MQYTKSGLWSFENIICSSNNLNKRATYLNSEDEISFISKWGRFRK
jgi:hypothetical protein